MDTYVAKMTRQQIEEKLINLNVSESINEPIIYVNINNLIKLNTPFNGIIDNAKEFFKNIINKKYVIIKIYDNSNIPSTPLEDLYGDSVPQQANTINCVCQLLNYDERIENLTFIGCVNNAMTNLNHIYFQYIDESSINITILTKI